MSTPCTIRHPDGLYEVIIPSNLHGWVNAGNNSLTEESIAAVGTLVSKQG